MPAEKRESFTFAALMVLLLTCLSRVPSVSSTEAKSAGGSWFRAELHHHSVFSDGVCSIDAITRRASGLGYNVLFLSDHDDSDITLTRIDDNNWGAYEYTPATYYDRVHTFAEAPVKTGSQSLFFRTNATIWASQRYKKSGGFPVLSRGQLFLNFSIYPIALTGNSDTRVEIVFGQTGVTWANGTRGLDDQTVELVFGLNTVLTNVTAWTHVIRAFKKPYALGIWNNYSMNLTEYMAFFPGGGLAPFTGIDSVSLVSTSGPKQLSETFFDGVVLYTRRPKSAAEVFAYRNSLMNTFSANDFKTYAGVEFSGFKHLNYFRWNFTSPTGFIKSNQIGLGTLDVVKWAHQQGYLIMLNHPTTLGSTKEDTVSRDAYCADLVEIASSYQAIQSGKDVWDGLLKKGVILTGVWTSDSHSILYEGAPATMIYSSDLTLEKLLKSLFEGRAFMARNNFLGCLVYNIRPSSEPYPARYVSYVSQSDDARLYIRVAQGLKQGWKLLWVRNGTYILNETITDTSLEITRYFKLPDEADYFRVEIRDKADAIIAMSQAIFFKKISDMPAGMYAHLDDVGAPDGKHFHNEAVKGITSMIYANQCLKALAYAQERATVTMKISSPASPLRAFVDGNPSQFTLNFGITTISFKVSGPGPNKIEVYYGEPMKTEWIYYAAVFGASGTIAVGVVWHKRKMVRKS